jgi:hypothetical protein
VFHVHEPDSASARDNSIFRLDYQGAAVRAVAITQSYARIVRIFEHEMFPGGPKELFVQGVWYRNEGICPIAGTKLVSEDPAHHFTHDSKFTPLNSCYQKPVAVWPHDPHEVLPPGDRRRTFFDVIDRNEEQVHHG